MLSLSALRSHRVQKSLTTYLLVLSAAGSWSGTTNTQTSSGFAWALSQQSQSCQAAEQRSMSTSAANNKLTVAQFPCLSDNYGYLIHCEATGDTASIDTPDGAEIDKQLQARGWTLTHIWNTHHHYDHVGGNNHLKKAYPDAVVYGPATEKIPHISAPVDGGDAFEFGQGMPVQVINVGGHTRGHIAYYLPEQAKLFCGDALFALGCGRMFEGTPEQFWASLLRLRALPDDTVVYCAHEYTAANARFALSVEPSNPALVKRAAEITALRQDNQFTVPSTLGEEKATNPFLRCDTSLEIQQKVGCVANTATTVSPDAVHAFAKVRAAKDNF